MSESPLPREVRRRLAIIQHAEEVTGNVAMTCRYYGISRQVYYTWLRRYPDEGVDGLGDRSRRPHHSPRATHVDVVGKILYLRKNYHFGPGKIAMYLKRYHDVEVSKSGIWRILKRLDLNRLPASQRYKRLDKRYLRYEKQLPGHQVQIDVKFVEPLKSAVKTGRRTSHEVLPVHRHRRLHPAPSAADLPALRPAHRHPIRRLRPRAPAVPGAGHPDR
jgi:transposase